MKTILRTAFLLVCAAPVIAIAACGGGATPPASPPAPTDTGSAASAMPSASAAPTDSAAAATSAAPSGSAAAAPAVWKDMNHAQRMDFMKHTVFPKMKDEFAGFDAKRYADMNCKTCHGDGAADGSFAMPNAKLPPVPATPDGFKKLMAKKPDACKFMMGKVVPDMAGMLNEPAYDPKTQQGFGCHGCHTDGSGAKK